MSLISVTLGSEMDIWKAFGVRIVRLVLIIKYFSLIHKDRKLISVEKKLEYQITYLSVEALLRRNNGDTEHKTIF